jgi:hypothetical protein
MNNRNNHRQGRSYYRKTLDGYRASERPEPGDPYPYEDEYARGYNDPNGFRNRDYIEENYWHPHEDGRRTNEYVPEFNYGRDEKYRRNDETSGYGNRNSQFMDDYERMMGKTRHNPNSGYGYYDSDFGERSRNMEDNDRYFSQEGYARQHRPGYGNDGRSYIDKQEARGNRGWDNEDSYSRTNREQYPDGGFNRDTGFNLRENDRRERRRPAIRDKRY